jgi:uncharacterized membrane protein
MVGRFLTRLGLAGAILIAAVFIFGALAGAVVVNRLSTEPAGNVQGQGESADKAEKAESGETADQQGQGRGQSNSKQANQGNSQKADSQDKSAEND